MNARRVGPTIRNPPLTRWVWNPCECPNSSTDARMSVEFPCRESYSLSRTQGQPVRRAEVDFYVLSKLRDAEQ